MSICHQSAVGWSKWIIIHSFILINIIQIIFHHLIWTLPQTLILHSPRLPLKSHIDYNTCLQSNQWPLSTGSRTKRRHPTPQETGHKILPLLWCQAQRREPRYLHNSIPQKNNQNMRPTTKSANATPLECKQQPPCSLIMPVCRLSLIALLALVCHHYWLLKMRTPR